MSITELARAEIRALRPYEAAIQVDNTIRLNANEAAWRSSIDAFDRPLNRYPEIRPARLRSMLASRYGCMPESLLVTRGTSEAIDLLMRVFCTAGIDNIVTASPTFSMYQHYAVVQGAGLRRPSVPVLFADCMDAPTVTDSELTIIEETFQAALANRSFDGLNVIGYGEIGLALGWPFDRPRMVVKRLPSTPTRIESEQQINFIRRYEEQVGRFVTLTPTEQRMIVNNRGWTVPYLVQPLLPKETLAEVHLAETDPVVDHPLVVAVRDVVIASNSDGAQAIDCQFSNFAWSNGELSYFDTGSPLLYRPDGSPEVEIGSYQQVLPTALMPVLRKLVAKVAVEMGTVEGGLSHAALSAIRIGQERWLDAILATFNQAIDTPIKAEDVLAQMDKVHSDMKSIKRLARLERAWATKVRRRPYDVFITDSFTKEIL